MDLNEERIKILDELAKESDRIQNKKDTILRLAKNLENSLGSPYVINLTKLVEIENPEKKDIALFMKRLRNTHFPNISLRYIYQCLPDEYKGEYNSVKKSSSEIIRLNFDNDNQRENIRKKLKQWDKDHTPAKPIIPKARLEDMEKYDWECHLANELAWLSIKMEKEHKEKHEDALCKEYAKRAKMVRDSRFATDAYSYDAIIVACNTTDSLKNSISGEWEFKTRWEVEEDERKCRESNKGECLGEESCRKEKCNHECHRIVRPMTTKGLKYAIKTNDDLKELDKHIKYLQAINNDICRMGKILLENPKTKKKLGVTEIKKLMYSHIEKDECLQCDIFLEKHPDFFEKEF